MNTRQSLEIERQRLTERFEEQPEGRVFAPLADCHRKLGNLEEALQICLTGLARHPQYSSAHVILGKIHLERGDTEAARAAFARVLELDAHNLLALKQLADLDEISGKLDEAMARWERIAALELDSSLATENIERIAGLITEQAEEAEKGVSAITDAVQIAPTEVTEPTPVESEPAQASMSLAPEAEAFADAVRTESGAAAESFEESPFDADVASDETAVEFEAPSADDESPAEAVFEDGPQPDPHADLQTEIHAEARDEAPAPAPESPAAPAPRAAASSRRANVPTAEIATMTLAEIYAEQGFREKALEIYRQILSRNPDVGTLRERIAALESDLHGAAPSASEGRDATRPRPATSAPADAQTARRESGASRPAALADASDAMPSPPLSTAESVESPRDAAGPTAEPGDEQERFNHFRSWLDRIRVDSD